MRAPRRYAARVAAALVAVAVSTTPAPTAAQPGSLWEELSALDLEGRRWDARRLAGRVVLLDFWATWCAPCLAELPVLRAARARHDPAELVILGVALDRGPRAPLVSFMRRHGVDWPQIHDGRGFGGSLARRFGVDTVPRSFLVDRQGRLVAVDLRGERLLAVLDALLASSAGDPRPVGGVAGDLGAAAHPGEGQRP